MTSSLRSQIHPITVQEISDIQQLLADIESSTGEDYWKVIVVALTRYGSRFLDYAPPTADGKPQRPQVMKDATELFMDWIAGRQISVEPYNSERRALMAAQFWIDAGDDAMFVAAELAQSILALPVANNLRDESMAAEILSRAASIGKAGA
jgi:hypothetical protein